MHLFYRISFFGLFSFMHLKSSILLRSVHVMSMRKNSFADNECVGGTVLSSAALIYDCMSLRESAILLVFLCVSESVCPLL